MSRSRKKNPIHTITCCRSQKWWKQNYNRRLRSHERDLLKQILKGKDPEKVIFPEVKDVSNIWTSPSDGKMYWDRPFWGDPEDYKRWIK